MNYKRLSKIVDASDVEQFYLKYKDLFDKWSQSDPEEVIIAVGADTDNGALYKGCNPMALAAFALKKNAKSEKDVKDLAKYWLGKF